MQQRFSSHGPPVDEIGPPASFNQLPHPEGDWTENHGQKQKKYNLVLAAATAFFAGTVIFVSEFSKIILLSLLYRRKIYLSGVILRVLQLFR